MTLKACSECGNIYETEGESYCPACRAQGHLYRLMSAPTLLLSAGKHMRLGYDEVATKRYGIATNLIRYATTLECIRVVGEEYSEAQHEGLDSQAAYKCAVEGLSQLLRDYDNIIPR